MFDFLGNSVHDCLELPLTITAANDKIICNRRDVAQINQMNILAFYIRDQIDNGMSQFNTFQNNAPLQIYAIDGVSRAIHERPFTGLRFQNAYDASD